jgi:peptidoglycan/xylan/chitin deacetylase (PgdA/CDA1 family)
MTNARSSSEPIDVVSDRYVTISVDDGSAGDMKTADLLHKYGLQATFYIPGRNPERPVIGPSQIRELSRRFEVGSHTLNHAPLKFLSDEKASHEISEGKQSMEEVLGEAVVSFCYPRGKFNGTTPILVKNAGFLGARTSLMNLHDFPRNPFLWGVSTQAYSHSKMIHVRHALLEGNFAGIRNFFQDYKGATDWEEHFSRALAHVGEHGGIAHMIMHSWEMEDLGQWKKLESVFAAISRSGLASVTNGHLYRIWSSNRVSPVPVAEPAGGPR